MSSVSVADVKKRIKKNPYEMLVGRDDSVCERAIDTAEIWAAARAGKAGVVALDFTSDGVREAVILRTLSELYSYNEQEEVAKDKLAMAREILDGYLGGHAAGEDAAPRPHASATEAEVPAWLATF